MSTGTTTPYILVCSTANTDTVIKFEIGADVTVLGRPDVATPATVDLRAIDPTLARSVSRTHARIRRTPHGYVLENWNGTLGVALFDKVLQPGEAQDLRHSYVFQIPALPNHFKVLFLANDQATQVMPLLVEPKLRQALVFGHPLALRPKEYLLLEYVYRHAGEICGYDGMIEHIWPANQRIGITKANLDELLSSVRKKMAQASGGFTFLQTVRGFGIRLVL